ncbi:MAG: HAMP domain-containing sensor histidine kinase [Lapillicoccus sp.]
MSSSRPPETTDLPPSLPHLPTADSDRLEHPSEPTAYGLPEVPPAEHELRWVSEPDVTRVAEAPSVLAAPADPSPGPEPATAETSAPIRHSFRLDPARLHLARLRHPSSWTLRAKLVVSMVALFTIITLATGAATTVALRGYLYQRVDTQLNAALQQPMVFGSNPRDDERPRGPGAEGLYAVSTLDNTVAQGYATDGANHRVVLTTAQLTTLRSAGIGSHPVNLNLGAGLGTYRLMSGQGFGSINGAPVPVTIVVGLPTAPEDSTIAQMVLITGLGVLAGLIIVALAGLWIVRRNLRPLDQVAATATRVAQLPLDRGQVALAERVPQADTDRRTEVGQVGAALNDMLDHIDEALQARQESEQRVRQFVADASHELRTPLASIRGYAELTKKEREPIPATVTHAIGRVESEAIRMSSLVEDLLLLARLDAGRPLDAAPVDLTEMVVNAVSDAHAASPDHLWQLDLPDEPVEVRGDSARLHQIIANLLANARTHTAPGTVVRTSLMREGDTVRITVHDNGPGVPAELQPNVFQRFARGDTSRNRAGGSTGLGLSIVAAVAQAHGGTVHLDSRRGDTTFTVLLPA